eukprot:scaffold1555_cov173-Amphora_coffeaeformis.AAC.19
MNAVPRKDKQNKYSHFGVRPPRRRPHQIVGALISTRCHIFEPPVRQCVGQKNCRPHTSRYGNSIRNKGPHLDDTRNGKQCDHPRQV